VTTIRTNRLLDDGVEQREPCEGETLGGGVTHPPR
jgi:hypothetical protein